MFTEKREIFIDHLRAFMFILMAFDHSLHAYAQKWGRFWFIQDFDRHIIWDGFYLFDQSIIMPMIFFIVGLNILPGLSRHGFYEYLKRRILKFGIPFVIGIIILVPLMTFPRHQMIIDPLIDYKSYFQEVFFFDKMQAGPLWVCYAIFLYSFVLILINKLFPSFVMRGGKIVYNLANFHPKMGIILIFIISGIILGFSDLAWGAPWWIGFGKLFYLQGAKFLLYFFYLFLGACVRASAILDDQEFMRKFSSQWKWWLTMTLLTAGVYLTYCYLYDKKGAYNDDFRKWLSDFFTQGGSWAEFWSFMSEYGWEILSDSAPFVLIRTSLQGILCFGQMLFLLSIFYQFFRTSTKIWLSLARNCYGIFLTHEVIVIWLQYFLCDYEISTFIKVALVFTVGFTTSWIISDKILLKTPVLRKIIG